MKIETPIQRAAQLLGGNGKLAKGLGVSPAYAWQIVNGKRPVQPKHAREIERLTGGEVSRSDLRPDIWPPEAVA